MTKKVGIETSSIMPLLEITPRTLPLQQHIKQLVGKYAVRFYTDYYSVKEATQQINTSFKSAERSIEKAKDIAERGKIMDAQTLSIIFVKSLAENWYGREETLRWSDVVICADFQKIMSPGDFFDALVRRIESKKQKYLSMLRVSDQCLDIDCKHIQSYWVTPSFTKELHIRIEVIPNKRSLEDFFRKLQSSMNTAYMERLRINDVIDIYHLYSLYYDGHITEVLSCNQQFVKRHEKYLKVVEEFKDLFDKKVVAITRIT